MKVPISFLKLVTLSSICTAMCTHMFTIYSLLTDVRIAANVILDVEIPFINNL